MSALFSADEERRIDRTLRSMEVTAEVRRRRESSRVHPDAAQNLDDLVQLADDLVARSRRISRECARLVDLTDELVELVGVHDSSLSVGAGTSTVATADSGGPQPGRGSEDSASRTTNERLPGLNLPPLPPVVEPGGTEQSVTPRQADNPPGNPASIPEGTLQ